jgi:hypothetical protein
MLRHQSEHHSPDLRGLASRSVVPVLGRPRKEQEERGRPPMRLVFSQSPCAMSTEAAGIDAASNDLSRLPVKS